MIDQRTVKIYSNQDLIKIGKKFPNSTAWRRSKEHKTQYKIAIQRGILHLCTAHMPRKAGIYSGIYQIYSYQFQKKVAYIGLTCVPEQRYEQHNSGGRVLAYANQCRVKVPEPIILQDKIMSPHEGQERERYWMAQFRGEGWTLLNYADGGSVGRIGGVIVSKWTREVVFEIAKKFHTVRDWVQFNSASYAVASKNGWLTEMTAHMVKRKTWTKEQILEMALRYDNVSDFNKKQASCSVIAQRDGFYLEATVHMSRKVDRRPVVNM